MSVSRGVELGSRAPMLVRARDDGWGADVVGDEGSTTGSGLDTSRDDSFPEVDCLEVEAVGVGDPGNRGAEEREGGSAGDGKAWMTLKSNLLVWSAAD